MYIYLGVSNLTFYLTNVGGYVFLKLYFNPRVGSFPTTVSNSHSAFNINIYLYILEGEEPNFVWKTFYGG